MESLNSLHVCMNIQGSDVVPLHAPHLCNEEIQFWEKPKIL